MSLVAVWVDQNQANLFQFTSGGIKKDHLKGHFPQHHTHGKDNVEDQRHEEAMFKELMPKLQSASQILILGPGMAKTHFKKYIENHNGSLKGKIVGCETTDHPSEPQLLSLASKFFNTEHLK